MESSIEWGSLESVSLGLFFFVLPFHCFSKQTRGSEKQIIIETENGSHFIFFSFFFSFLFSPFFFFLLLGRDPPNPSPYTSSSFHYEQSPKKRGYAPVGNGQRMKVVSFGRGWLGPEDDLNGEFDRSSGLMDSSVERETRLGHGSVIFGWV